MAAFLAVVLALALPWFVAVCVYLPDFAGYFLWHHNVVRFLHPFDHLQPLWFYAPVLLFGLLPGTLLLVPFARFLVSADDGGGAAAAAGTGLPAAGRRLVRPVFLRVGVEIAHLRPAGVPAAGAGLRPIPDGARLGPPALAGRAGRGRLRADGAAAHLVVLPWYAGQRAPMGRPAEVRALCGDRAVPVICFPRSCDSVSFYLGRDDLRSFREKQMVALLDALHERPRTVVLCTHRHTLTGLRGRCRPTCAWYTPPISASARG